MAYLPKELVTLMVNGPATWGAGASLTRGAGVMRG